MPTYTYDDYAAQKPIDNMAMTPEQSYRHGSSGDPTGYTTKPGQSNMGFLMSNYGPPQGGSALSARSAYSAAGAMVGDPVAAYNMYRGFKKMKSNRADIRRREEEFARQRDYAVKQAPTDWLNTQDPTSALAQETRRRAAQGQQMTGEEVNAGLRMQAQAEQRAGYDKSINEYFGSADRAGWQQSIVSNQLNDDLANISQSHKENTRSAALSAASRGTMKGSVDIENRSAIARNRDTSAISAAANADATKAGFQDQDRDSRQQLHGLVQSQDIGSADQLRTALDGIRSTTNAQGAQFNAQRQQQQINNFGAQQQSQAWGGGLNALATGVGSWNASPTARHGGW